MLKRSLRIKVMAAMFSPAFLFGISLADAYTYTNITQTVNKVIEDESDLIVTNGAQITCDELINPKKITVITNNAPKNYESMENTDFIYTDIVYHTENDPFDKNYPPTSKNTMALKNCDKNMNITTLQMLKSGCGNPYTTGTITAKTFFEIDNTTQNIILTKDILTNQDIFYYINNQYGEDCNFGTTDVYFRFILYDDAFASIKTNGDKIMSTLKEKYPNLYNVVFAPAYFYVNGKRYSSTSFDISLSILYNTSPFCKNNTENSSILVSKDAILSSKGNIQTTKEIIVKDNSRLRAKNNIIGNNIYSDKAIISTTNDQGESIITPGNITATGALKSDTYIGAVSGAVSGNTVYSGGDIVSANSIKAGGLAKGNVLKVAAINAASASITGNQSISGIFTTTGQAKLNGGVALGGKKITGLSIGTLSTSSTDAVNGKQLYTAMQSSGKTYAAGSDISISSANAISVAKAGKVASGDTGIMTGDAVYKETSKIVNAFKANNASITSNNSKLDNLTTSIESLRKSLGTINSSVSDAISGLPGSLANFANKDLTDLSDTGINTLKSYIKSEIKKQMPSNSKTASYAMEAAVSEDTSIIDNIIASKADTSDLTALEKKVDGKSGKDSVSLLEDKVNAKADLSYVNDGLAKKADQSVVEAVSGDVTKNTSAIAKNTELIQSNAEAISGLKDSKADSSCSNIDVSSWSDKLGTGIVAKDDTGLVTGSSAASALDKKADIGYVAMGLGAMEGSLEQVNQSVTKDVSRVGAGASALMGLHPTGDKFEFATAYGHYKNSNNTALGVFYKPSANSTVSMAGTIGNGDAMLSAGVSIKLGLNKEVKKVITPEEFGAMKTAVDSQDEKLDQMEKTLQQLMAR